MRHAVLTLALFVALVYATSPAIAQFAVEDVYVLHDRIVTRVEPLMSTPAGVGLWDVVSVVLRLGMVVWGFGFLLASAGLVRLYRRGFSVGLLLLSLLSASPSAAQFAVEDIYVGAQTTIAALNSARELVQQSIQIANEAAMIQNQLEGLAYEAANLTKSPLQLAPTVSALLGQQELLLRRVDGLGFDVEQLVGKFPTTYPAIGGPLLEAQAAVTQVQGWLKELRGSSQTAVQTQAILPTLQRTRAMVEQALQQSAASAGRLAAQQNTNQLLGILAQGQASAHQTAAASARVQTLFTLTQTELADQAAQDAAAHVAGMSAMQEVQSIGIPQFR
jgi:conjugal transfer/entry exclusion protein